MLVIDDDDDDDDGTDRERSPSEAAVEAALEQAQRDEISLLLIQLAPGLFDWLQLRTGGVEKS